MSEMLKSIIFGIFGIVIATFGIIAKAGVKCIGFGIAITIMAIAFIIYDNAKAKKNKKVH